MKLNKIVLPLALALAAMLSTTGCKHGFNGKVTTLPGHRPPPVADNNGNLNPLPQGNPLPPGDNANGNGNPFGANANPNGTFPTTPDSVLNPDNYTKDATALAAYTVHFKFDSAVVQDSEQANVANVGQALASDPNARLQIEGHCDERGTEEYNRSLGERRALALREALAKDGVDPLHIVTISFGKDKPEDPGHDEAAWSKNRRGVFILLHPKTPVQ